MFDSVQASTSEEIHPECIGADEFSHADEGLGDCIYLVQALYLNEVRKFLQSSS